VSLGTRTGILILGNLAYRLGQTATLMLVVRLVAPEMVGTYRQVWMIYNSISVMFLLGLPGSIYHHLASATPASHRRLLRQTMLLLALSGGVFALLLAGLAPGLAKWLHNPALAPALFAIIPYALLNNAFGYDYPFFVVYRRAWLSAGITSATAVAQLIATVVVLKLGGGLPQLFLLLGALAAARFIVTALLAWRQVAPGEATAVAKTVGEQLHFSVPLCLADAMSMLQVQVDKWVASLFYNAAAFAQYSIGATPLPFITVVRSAVYSVLLSEISALRAAGDIQRILAVWRAAVRKTGLLFLPLLALCLLVAKPLMSTFFTAQFSAAALPFQIYLGTLLVMIYPAPSVLLSLGLSWYNLRVNLIGIALAIGAGVALGGRLGLAGPALAVVVSQVLVLWWQLRRIAQHLETTPRALLALPSLAGALWASAAAALPTAAVMLLPAPPLVSLLLQGAIYTVSYIFLLFRANLLTAHEHAQAQSLLHPGRLLRQSRLAGAPAEEPIGVGPTDADGGSGA
jgi:O-antigen/teichoic acid export membrane protein